MRDRILALRARRHGARFCVRIIRECRALGLSVPLGFAMVEQETGFKNIYGHDPTIFVGAGRVTRWNYRRYKAARGPLGHGGMQGVGPLQLTWYATQDEADRQGGCWRPGINIKVGLTQLEANIRAKGEHAGIAAYNGSGTAAARYADQVQKKAAIWSSRLA